MELTAKPPGSILAESHFGLAGAAVVDSIEVTWPDGTASRRERVTADQIVEIRASASSPK